MSNGSAWHAMKGWLNYYFQKPLLTLRKSSFKQKARISVKEYPFYRINLNYLFFAFFNVAGYLDMETYSVVESKNVTLARTNNNSWFFRYCVQSDSKSYVREVG